MGLRYSVIMLGLGGLVIPLACIALSIALSPWFNFWFNALSDLGRVSTSLVAPIFNFGLVIGGYLISLLSFKYLIKYSMIKSLVLNLAAIALILVGTFNEDYGSLHFNVSVAFFLLMATYLVIDSVIRKSILPTIALIPPTTLWVTHFIIKSPPGAAVPEIVSIASFIPFYLRDVKSLIHSGLQ